MNASEIRELEDLLARRPQAWFWISNYTPDEMTDWYRQRAGEVIDGDWWTCDPDVAEGDVAFAYVSKPTSSVIAVKVAATAARQLQPREAPDYDIDGEPGWVCDWRFVGVLAEPLPFKALRINDVLAGEHGVQMSFNGRSFPCSPEAFAVLAAKLIHREKKALAHPTL